MVGGPEIVAAAAELRAADLDPGLAFAVFDQQDSDRLPGSTSYMAPEEFTRGAVIDERTTVFNLGRLLHHLFASDDGWRGTIHQSAVVEVATDTDPLQRHTTVAALFEDWARATENSQLTR